MKLTIDRTHTTLTPVTSPKNLGVSMWQSEDDLWYLRIYTGCCMSWLSTSEVSRTRTCGHCRNPYDGFSDDIISVRDASVNHLKEWIQVWTHIGIKNLRLDWS